VFGEDVEVAAIFDQESVHCGTQGWGMNPIDGIHLLNERALANDGANKVQTEYGGVVPVARHQSPD